MTRYQEGKINDRYGNPAGLPAGPSPGSLDLAREAAGQGRLDDGVVFVCRTGGCQRKGKLVSVPAGWARIGTACKHCGMDMEEGGEGSPVEG